MSDYGLLVKNNSEEIQIDSTYRNLSLDESDTDTISNNNTDAGYYASIDIADSVLVPLILFQPNTDYFSMVSAYIKSGSNFASFNMATECDGSSSPSGPQTTSVNWRSYRQNRAASGDSYGLLVYNAAGELCFDSGKSYFKVYSVTNVSLSAPAKATFPSTDITHAGISNPFYILTPVSYYLNMYPLDATFTNMDAKMVGLKKLSSTSVRVGWSLFRRDRIQAQLTHNEGLNPAMKLIICDI